MTPIDRQSDRPVYKQIADELRGRIQQGEFGPGGQLPSENHLAAANEVTRRTVQNALKLLVTEGVVVARHGSGYFVAQQLPVRRLASDRFARRHRQAGKAAFTVEMEKAGKAYDVKTDVEMLRLGEGIAPDEIRQRLKCDPDELVLIRSRRYQAEGSPLQIATSYVPLEIAQGTAIAEADTGPGGIYARIEECGFQLTRIVEDIKVESATEEIRKLLHLHLGSSVLHLIRTAYAGDRAVEVCDTLMNPTAFELSYELPAR